MFLSFLFSGDFQFSLYLVSFDFSLLMKEHCAVSQLMNVMFPNIVQEIRQRYDGFWQADVKWFPEIAVLKIFSIS